MNKKNIIISVAVVVIMIFSGGAFLLYSSYIKTKELQAKIKIEEEKTKQEMIKGQNEQKSVQVTVSKETVPASASADSKRRTDYETELMNRMSSFSKDDYQRADEVFKAWDKELNQVYKLLMSELSQDEKTKLRNEERIWLKRKEREIKRRAAEMCAGTDENGNLYGCGTGYGTEARAADIEMTKERTIELARMYDELHNK